jgi:hypothetical protein
MEHVEESGVPMERMVDHLSIECTEEKMIKIKFKV